MEAAAVLEGWVRTIVSEGAIGAELLLGGWSDAVLDAVGSLPASLGEDEYRRLKERGAALSDDEVVKYLVEEVDRLEQDQR